MYQWNARNKSSEVNMDLRAENKVRDIIEIIQQQKSKWVGHVRRNDNRWSKRLFGARQKMEK